MLYFIAHLKVVVGVRVDRTAAGQARDRAAGRPAPGPWRRRAGGRSRRPGRPTWPALCPTGSGRAAGRSAPPSARPHVGSRLRGLKI